MVITYHGFNEQFLSVPESSLYPSSTVISFIVILGQNMASVTRAKERSVVWHLWQDNDGINRNSYRTYLQTLVSSDKTVVLNILSMIKQRFSTSFRLTIEQKMYKHVKCNLPMRKIIWVLRVFQAAKITLRTNFNYLLSLVGNHCLQLFSFF